MIRHFSTTTICQFSTLSKYLPKTLLGQTLRGQIIINPKLDKVINNDIMTNHLPNNLRRIIQKFYIKLRDTEMFPSVKTPLETDSFIGAFFLRDYGSCYQVLHELKKRLDLVGFTPKSILDVSHGPSTGMLVLNDLLNKHNMINNNNNNTSNNKLNIWGLERKDSVIISNSEEMSKRARLLLGVQPVEKQAQTKLMSTVPTSIKYDLIILNHQMLRDPKKYPYEIDSQLNHYLSLLSDNGGYLVILERGTPTGAETIARVRELLLRQNNQIVGDTDGAKKNNYFSIIAPCSHMKKCPLQVSNLNYYKLRDPKNNDSNDDNRLKISRNLKFISFSKMIQRPKFSIELKRGKLLSLSWKNQDRRKLLNLRGKGRPNGRNYELVNYTYLIIGKSVPSLEMDSWPRIISPPIKKKGHVILNVCTVPEGKIENWIIPKSMSKKIYHDARKSKWGDLWPHGAKTRIPIRSKIDFDSLKELERERIKNLKIEERKKQVELRKRLIELDDIKEPTKESIDEIANIYKNLL